MITMLKLTRYALALLLFICPLAMAGHEEALEKALAQFDKKMNQTMKEQHLPGAAVAVVSKNQILYLKTFGVKKVGTGDQITPSTLFQLASLSKPINATLVAVLQKQGKLTFDEPVNDILPDFKSRNSKNPLKINHLLSHSTGISSSGYNELIEHNVPREQIVTKLQNARAVAPPGKQFAYHNAMYGLIEDVITKVSHKSYMRTMKEDLFIPFGMKSASLGYQALLAAPDKAYPHVKNNRGRYVPAEKYSQGYYAFSAAGGVNASLQDMISFLQVYLGKPNSVLSQKDLRQLTAPFVKNPRAVIISQERKGKIHDTYYGMGWQSMIYGKEKVLYHSGHLKGFRHFMGFIEDDVGIIILTNADKKHASKLALNFFSYYLGK